MRWLKTDLLGTAFQFLWRIKQQNGVGKHRAWPKRRKLSFGKTQCFCWHSVRVVTLPIKFKPIVYLPYMENDATTEHVIFPCTVTCPGFLELQKCDQAVISGDYSDLFQVFLLYFVFLCYISYFLSVKSKDRNVHGILKERKHVISPFVQSPQGSQR